MAQAENSEEHQNGSAISILGYEGEKLVLDHFALKNILKHPKIGSRRVAVLSIAGALRQGKSFMLNFFLKYLRNEGCQNANWIGDPDEPLTGFEWRGGCDAETEGILMWSEPFILNQNGEEKSDHIHTTSQSKSSPAVVENTIALKNWQIAVLLCDTQGNFALETGMDEGTKVFAMSLLLSSIFVFNIKDQVQANVLEHFQFCSAYSTKARGASDKTSPFQRLFFLIRDWSNPYQYEYGIDGGKKYLDKKILHSEPNQLEENSLRSIRRALKESFHTIDCFLMPPPGTKVAVTEKEDNFKGEWKDIDERFVKKIRELTSCLLLPENLVIKQPARAEALLEYTQSCWSQIERGDFPKVKSLLEYAAKATVLTARRDGEKLYKDKLEQALGQDPNRKYIDWDLLELKSNEAREEALTQLQNKSFEAVKEEDKNRFLEDLGQIYSRYVGINRDLEEKKSLKLQKVREQAIDEYEEKMKKEISGGYKSQEELKELHDSLSGEFISQCDEFKGDSLYERCVERMTTDFEVIHGKIRQLNETNKPITKVLASTTAAAALTGAGGGAIAGIAMAEGAVAMAIIGTAGAAGGLLGAGAIVAGVVAGGLKLRNKWKKEQIYKELAGTIKRLRKDTRSRNL